MPRKGSLDRTDHTERLGSGQVARHHRLEVYPPKQLAGPRRCVGGADELKRGATLGVRERLVGQKDLASKYGAGGRLGGRKIGELPTIPGLRVAREWRRRTRVRLTVAFR